MRSSRLILPIIMVAGLLLPVHVQAQNGGVDVETYFAKLQDKGGTEGDQAAFHLFKLGTQDERLLGIMVGRGKKHSRLSILRALKYSGHTRPGAALKLAQAGLSDEDPAVVSLAIARASAIRADQVYPILRKAFDQPPILDPKDREHGHVTKIRWASLQTKAGKQARGLLDVIERLGNPIKATRVLVDVLQDRLHRTLEGHLSHALERLTAQRFASRSKWKDWIDSVEARELSFTAWEQEKSERQETRQRETMERAESYFKLLLAAQQSSPDQLLKTLQTGLNDVAVPTVCKRAIDELGRIGGDARSPIRKQAVGLLRERLKKAGPDYDEITATVIEALGRTGDRSILNDVLGILNHTSPRMRASAARALAALRASAAIPRLLDQVVADEDPDLVEAAALALGEIGVNAIKTNNKTLVVSDALVRFCKALLAQNGSAGPQSGRLLAAVARALGKLQYGTDADALARVIDLLSILSARPDTNVRFEAIAALGPLPTARAFKVLSAQLDKEKEIHIRKAILDAMGMQAIARPGLATQTVQAMVPFLFATDPAERQLREMSQERLRDLARDKSLTGLLSIVRTLLKRDHATALPVALPFLRGLTRTAPKDPQTLTRWLEVLEVRGRAQIVAAPDEALKDFEAVLTTRGWHTTDTISATAMPLFLNKARALLRVSAGKRANDALGIAEDCLKAKPSAELLPEVWKVALDALEKLKQTAPTELPAFLGKLEPYVSGAPEAAQKRFSTLKGKGS